MTIESMLQTLNMFVRNGPWSREVEDELRFHIEMRTRDNVAAGMTPEDAADDAARRFGDFDQLRVICEEIKKERLVGTMKVAKGITWVMIGCGLTLKMTSGIFNVVGFFLILIAVLWRLLIHLRQIQPDQKRINAAALPTLSIIYTIGDFSSSSPAEQSFKSSSPAEQSFKPVVPYDKAGRTPVERLLSDEE